MSRLDEEEQVRRQYGDPVVADYHKKIENMVPEKKKKKKRTTVKANAYAAEIKAKANAAKANANKANAEAREKANAEAKAAATKNKNNRVTEKRKHTKPTPRVRVRPLNLNLNEVDNPKRWNAFNNVIEKRVKLVTEKRKHTKPTPRVRVKGTPMNGLTLMNRKEANQERKKEMNMVKGTPMNSFLNLSLLRQKQKQEQTKNKNAKRITLKDRKESALARIMETVNLSKAKYDLEQMAPNSPGTKFAKELKKEEEKYSQELEKEQKDRNFDEKMPTFHQLATENGINEGLAHNLHQMSEKAHRTRVILNAPKEENTLPNFTGLVENGNQKKEKPKPKRKANPTPRGRAVPRPSRKPSRNHD